MGVSLEIYRFRIGYFALIAGRLSAAEPTRLSWGKANDRKTIRNSSQILRSLFCLFCLLLAAILILRCGNVHAYPGPVTTLQDFVHSESTMDTDDCSIASSEAVSTFCPLCGGLWQHIKF